MENLPQISMLSINKEFEFIEKYSREFVEENNTNYFFSNTSHRKFRKNGL